MARRAKLSFRGSPRPCLTDHVTKPLLPAVQFFAATAGLPSDNLAILLCSGLTHDGQAAWKAQLDQQEVCRGAMGPIPA